MGANRTGTNHFLQTLLLANRRQPEIQTTIKQWPDTTGVEESVTSEKVPTELLYEDGEVRWGFQIPEREDRYQWFKLELDPDLSLDMSRLSLKYPSSNALPPTYSNSAGQLAIDYLRCLREHVIKILRNKLGDGVVDTTPFEFIITAPAIWSDSAKDRTRNCGKQAGMGKDIRIISEPEAAVVYALDSLDPHNLTVGDTFVLCDAGGGTVDLVSYTITELLPSVKIREAVAGFGDRCGSTFLNRIFRDYLRDNFSHLEGWEDDTMKEAMERFETVAKRKFKGDDDLIIPVQGLANDPGRGIARGKLTVKAEQVVKLFEPVITTITTMIKSQLNQTKGAKAVILVGGFGQSPYLRECVKQIVGKKVEVRQPAQGWTAVVRGALIKALADTDSSLSRVNIAARIARKAYGTTQSVKFDPAKHDARRT